MKANIIVISIGVLILVGLAIGACLRFYFYAPGRILQEGRVIAEVNGYKITDADFAAELDKTKIMAFGEGKERGRVIMDNLINNAIILKEAERTGVDKDKDFVKTVERFWQQSLIKLTLERKIEEIRSRSDIKTKKAEEKAFEDWLTNLRKKADIEIYDERFIDITEGR